MRLNSAKLHTSKQIRITQRIKGSINGSPGKGLREGPEFLKVFKGLQGGMYCDIS